MEPLAVGLSAALLLAAGAVWGGGGTIALSTAGWRPILVMLSTAAAAGALAWKRCRAAHDAAQVTRAMAESLARLDEMRYALDQAAIVAITDQRGVITYVNDKFCAISQYSAARSCSVRTTASSTPAITRRSSSAICGGRSRSGRVWRGEIRNRAKDGCFYWVDTTIVPFLDGTRQAPPVPRDPQRHHRP